MTLALWLLVSGLALWGWSWLLRYQVRRRGADPALLILPPRRYVDADGRSDFRPECLQRTSPMTLWAITEQPQRQK